MYIKRVLPLFRAVVQLNFTFLQAVAPCLLLDPLGFIASIHSSSAYYFSNIFLRLDLCMFFANFNNCFHRSFTIPTVPIRAHYSRFDIAILGIAATRNVPRQFPSKVELQKLD